MKTIKLLCALAAGLAIVIAQEVRAVVIGGEMYVPLNLKLTVSVVENGKIVRMSATSKNLLNDLIWAQDLNLPLGTYLAVGPSQHVYAITATTVVEDLSAYFYFDPEDLIETEAGSESTGMQRAESGTIKFEYANQGYLAKNGYSLDSNQGAFSLTGTYTYAEKVSPVVNGYVSAAAKFSSVNLGGASYWVDLDEFNYLPLSATATGAGSGKGLIW